MTAPTRSPSPCRRACRCAARAPGGRRAPDAGVGARPRAAACGLWPQPGQQPVRAACATTRRRDGRSPTPSAPWRRSSARRSRATAAALRGKGSPPAVELTLDAGRAHRERADAALVRSSPPREPTMRSRSAPTERCSPARSATSVGGIVTDARVVVGADRFPARVGSMSEGLDRRVEACWTASSRSPPRPSAPARSRSRTASGWRSAWRSRGCSAACSTSKTASGSCSRR